MAKFKVVLEFEFEADSAEDAEQQYWEWDDQEFLEESQAAKLTVEPA
jgi:hypothetical protein